MRVRIPILLGELCLAVVSVFAMLNGFEAIAGVAVGGIVATLDKVVQKID